MWRKRVVFGLGFAVAVLVQPAVAAETDAPKAAASRPASEIVLVRVGESAITQEDFNREVSGMPLERVAKAKVGVLRSLIGQRLLSLYLDEHPELVDQAKLDDAVATLLEKEGVKTRAELEKRLIDQGTPGKLDLYLSRLRTFMGREAIVRKSTQRADDEKTMRELWDRDPRAFNGTRMFVRHIRIDFLPWDTPEQLQAKRDKAERIRADLVSGRRTWEECVAESDSPTKVSNGEIGYVSRHREEAEAIAETAFRLQPGQTSEVVADRTAFHIVQVTKEHLGDLTFEEAKLSMRLWLEWEPLILIDAEMQKKHPIVGVREPDMPPPPASLPAPVTDPASQPAGLKKPPATRPATATRPGMNRPGANRPAMNRPGTRPATGRPLATQPAGARRPNAAPAQRGTAPRPATRPR